jgi:hypothetical protein
MSLLEEGLLLAVADGGDLITGNAAGDKFLDNVVVDEVLGRVDASKWT